MVGKEVRKLVSHIPGDLKYTAGHMWLRIEGGQATIGITDYGQAFLNQVVFVALPKVGASLTRDSFLGEIESTKAGSDLYAALSGKVVAINESIIATPELVNAEPYGRGWLVKIQMSDRTEIEKLLSAEAYTALLGEEA